MVAKVIGVSGAQGGGKSTLLEGLKSAGWQVDDFKVSRAVQADAGWGSLSQVLSDVLTMTRFQEEVLRRKRQHDQALRENGQGIILTERTFADIYSYTTFWTWELVDARKWSLAEGAGYLAEYKEMCLEAQRECYDGVIALPLMDHIVWQNDPNRADKASANLIWENIELFLRDISLAKTPGIVIQTRSVEDRVAEVETFLRKL